MSVRIMSLVWDKFPSGGSEMLVLLAMADWCNDNGLSLHPSNEAVAEKCRISKVQAQRIIKSLTDDGWLAVIGNKFGGAPGSTKQYRLCIERFDGYQKDTGITGDTGITRRKRRVSPSAETGITHATQTTIEPSIEPPVLGDKSPKQVRAHSLPSDFAPSTNHFVLANEVQINLHTEFPQFVDHHKAKGSRMVSWDAALNTWIRNAAKFGRRNHAPPTKQSNRDSYDAQAKAAQDRLNLGERYDNSTERDITSTCTVVA